MILVNQIPCFPREKYKHKINEKMSDGRKLSLLVVGWLWFVIIVNHLNYHVQLLFTRGIFIIRLWVMNRYPMLRRNFSLVRTTSVLSTTENMT